MRFLAILFLIGGVALAGGAIYYANEQFKSWQASVTTKETDAPELVRVVAAKVPLKHGDRLNFERGKQALKFVFWPKDAVPDNVFHSAQELFDEDLKQVRTVTRRIEPGELILKSKVTGFGGSVRIATQVREGMRAVTIPINAVTGTAGLISPGDFVDIQYLKKKDGELTSHILMQKVLVVATDQLTDTERSRAVVARTAMVEVSPKDAQRLTLAMQTGSLSLLLRGVDEVTTSEDLESVDTTALPGAEVKEEPIVKEEPETVVEEDTSYRVRVRKGGQVHEERFSD